MAQLLRALPKAAVAITKVSACALHTLIFITVKVITPEGLSITGA